MESSSGDRVTGTMADEDIESITSASTQQQRKLSETNEYINESYSLDLISSINHKIYYNIAYIDSMGKCVSKQEPHSLGQYNGNSNSYIAISEKSDELSSLDDDEGQSESKKNAKRAAAAAAAAAAASLPGGGANGNGTGMETKGTAMSFGFKKKTQSFLSSKSSKNKNHQQSAITHQQHNPNDSYIGDKEKLFSTATVITNPSILKNSDDNDNNIMLDDKNGNRNGSIDSLNEHESIQLAQSGSVGNNNNNNINNCGGRTTPRLVPPKKDSSGLPYRPNRFGFRQSNVVRPASAGLTPKMADNDFVGANGQNNNSITYNNNLNVKRRSKSAGTTASQTRTVTPNSSYLNHHQQQQQKQQEQLHQHLQSYNNGDFPKIKSALYHNNLSQSQEQQPQHHQQHKVKFSSEDNNQYYEHHQPHYQPTYSVTQHINKTSGGNHYTVVKTDLHTNPIVKPTPQSVAHVDSVSKFTLHTTNLPKPQYPVPISLPPRNVMDTKVAKQALNSSRRQGFQGPREISSDSGICSYDSFGERQEVNYSPRKSLRNSRPRNLQMVMKGRNAFEVRDFDDSLSDESIVPLVLPTLPSAFCSSTQAAPLSGLIRTDQYDDLTSSNEMRKLSLVSSDIESLEDDRNTGGEEEEEKLSRDKSSTEKYNHHQHQHHHHHHHHHQSAQKNYGLNSKNSSPASSRASWEIPGETMAANECSSSLSLTSSDGSKNVHQNRNTAEDPQNDEEDISSVTITMGVPLSSLTMTAPIQTSYTACDEIDLVSKPTAFLDTPSASISSAFTLDHHRQPEEEPEAPSQPIQAQGVRNVMLTIKDKKFAEMVADADNATLLDDETSPSDSLVSSCTDSDDVILKKNKKKINDQIKEKEIKDFLTEELDCMEDDDFENDNNDISPVIDLTSPLSGPGSPTHASNSFSLSDAAGRDFLIDDEIADQPALVFDDGKNDDLLTTSLMLQSVTDNTPTLIDSSTNHRNNNNNTMNISSSRMGSSLPPIKSRTSKLFSGPSPMHSGASTQNSKPKNPMITRTESLDTLSPCESIASDDLMMDFECGSMDSIDRGGMISHNGSGSGSALHSMDETQLWSEIEAQGGDIAREWTSLLRSQKSSFREDLSSQLPARATRLLNRSRLAQPASGTGSDSPRSLDSVSRRTPLHKSHTYQVPEDMVLVDKSVRNSMLQDVVHLKKQLVRLRRLLQEDEDVLMRTETLNPFEHGQFFANCGLDLLKQTALSSLEERDSGSLTPSLIDDPKQELADLRRQVVFLQGQIDDKDRTIRLQQTLILKLEEEKDKTHACTTTETPNVNDVETVNTATQTERLRPLSMGQDGISRSEEKTQNNTKNHQQNIKNLSNSNIIKQLNCSNTNNINGGSSSINKTSLSSSTTALSSSTLPASPNKSPASTAVTHPLIKTVRTTQIGNVYTTKKIYEASCTNGTTSNGNAKQNGSTDTVMATTLQNNNKNLLKLNINGNSNNNCNSNTSNIPVSPSKKIPTLVRTQYNNYLINNNNHNKNNIINNKIITNGNSSGNSSLNSSCSSLNSKLIIDGNSLVKH